LKLNDPGVSQSDLQRMFVYDPDTGVFTRRVSCRNRKAGSVAGHICTSGYWQITLNGRFLMAHRLAWLYVYGHWPNGILDHINRERADNRICNLRLADRSVNQINAKTRSDNTCGARGVMRTRTGKYVAYAVVARKYSHGGHYQTIEEAAEAARRLRIKLYGEFAL